MKFRPLADTGVFVSELCLGTMTFGGVGQIWEVMGALDQAGGRRHRAPRARRRHQLHRHRERLRRGRVGDAGRQGDRRPAPRHRAGDQGARPHGPGRQPGRPVAPAHRQTRRGEPEAARHRLHRPLPDPPLGSAHQHRGHAARARRSGARRQGALHRLLEPAGVAADEGARQSRASSGSSASAARSRTTRWSGATSSATRFRC